MVSPTDSTQHIAVQLDGHDGGCDNNLRQIAIAQRRLMYCLLGQVASLFGLFTAPSMLRNYDFAGSFFAAINLTYLARVYLEGLESVLLLLNVAYGPLTGFFVYHLVKRTCGVGVAMPLSILAAVPFLGIFIQPIINQAAIVMLKEKGIHVGFVGAADITHH